MWIFLVFWLIHYVEQEKQRKLSEFYKLYDIWKNYLHAKRYNQPWRLWFQMKKVGLTTSIKQLDLLDILVTQSNALSNGYARFLWGQGWLGPVLGKGVRPIVHYWAVVVGLAKQVHIRGTVFVKIMFFACREKADSIL